MKGKIGLIFALALVQFEAAAQEHAVAGRAGLLGLGLEYSYGINDRVGVRGMLYGSGLSFDATESGIDYDFDLDWDSLGVAVDFHPFAGPFRLSAGLLSNDNSLRASSTPAENVVIGDTSYTPDEIGSLDADIGFDGTAPMLGIGWDWSKSKRFGFTLDLGLVKQGAPNVALSANGGLVEDAAFEADLEAEEAELREALDDLDLVPFVSLGMSFRF
jgi:hypothetical protein